MNLEDVRGEHTVLLQIVLVAQDEDCSASARGRV